jgi:hypothetical protein
VLKNSFDLEEQAQRQNSTSQNGGYWPRAPVDRRWRDGCYRGIAAVASAKFTGSNGSTPEVAQPQLLSLT